MTDLERAAEVVDAMGREIGDDRVFWPETRRRKIQAALAAARRKGAEAAQASFTEAYGLAQKHQCEAGYRRGAEEMRDRAAALLPKEPTPEMLGLLRSAWIDSNDLEDHFLRSYRAIRAQAGDHIRALSLTPEEPV